MLGGQAVFREQHPHPAGPSQPGGQLAVAAQRAELITSAVQEQEHPSGVRSWGVEPVGGHPPAVTSLTSTSSGTGWRRSPGTKAARRCSSVGRACPALAFCRSLRALTASCMAWLGMSASPSAWADCLFRRFGWQARMPTLPPITRATPADRVAGGCAVESYGPDDPNRRTSRCGPVFHLNVRSAILRAWRTRSGTTAEPQPATTALPGGRAGPAGTGGHLRHAATKAGPYPRGQRRSGVLCSLERQLRPRRPCAARAEAGDASTGQ
jgi:hypothetical protein